MPECSRKRSSSVAMSAFTRYGESSLYFTGERFSFCHMRPITCPSEDIISVAMLDSGFSIASNVGKSPNTPLYIMKNKKPTDNIPPMSVIHNTFLKRPKRPVFFTDFFLTAISVMLTYVDSISSSICYFSPSAGRMTTPTLLTPGSSTFLMP